MSVQGVKEIKMALESHQKATERGNKAGLIKAGVFLQKESQEIVPIDKNFLRPSAETIWEGEGFNTVVSVGYTASYAIYVHEDLEARHKPGKSAKFLEKPARTKGKRMAEIYTDTIRDFLP